MRRHRLPRLTSSGRLPQAFVQTVVRELVRDSFFRPIRVVRGVDRHGDTILDASGGAPGWAFLVRCGLLDRQGQGRADGLCIPVCGGLRAQMLRECHDRPLGGHFGWAKSGSLLRSLVFWVGKDVDVAEIVRTSQVCQRTKTEHCCQSGLVHPLPPSDRVSRHGGAGS